RRARASPRAFLGAVGCWPGVKTRTRARLLCLGSDTDLIMDLILEDGLPTERHQGTIRGSAEPPQTGRKPRASLGRRQLPLPLRLDPSGIRSGSSRVVRNERNHEEDDKDPKEDSRAFHGNAGNAAKPNGSGDERHDEEDDGVVQ